MIFTLPFNLVIVIPAQLYPAGSVVLLIPPCVNALVPASLLTILLALLFLLFHLIVQITVWENPSVSEHIIGTFPV